MTKTLCHAVAILVILSGVAALAGAEADKPAPAYKFAYQAETPPQILDSKDPDLVRARNANAWAAYGNFTTQDKVVEVPGALRVRGVTYLDAIMVEKIGNGTSTRFVTTPMTTTALQEAAPTLKDRAFITPNYLVVFAESDEKAKEYFVQAVDAMNAWWKAHRADHIKEHLGLLQKEIEESQAHWAGQQKQLAAAQKVLGDLPQDLGPEAETAIATMKVQLVSMDVEMAGVKTRIEAAKKVLADRSKLNSQQTGAVEAVLLSAQIEMAGLEARRQRAKEVLDAYQTIQGMSRWMSGTTIREPPIIKQHRDQTDFLKKQLEEPASPFVPANGAVVDLVRLQKGQPVAAPAKKSE